MLTPEREALVRRVRHIRTHKPIQIADFWNDGHLTGGCIAGGRRYFHINARGDVEPCAFVHFAVDTIFGKSLVEILQNPIFKAYQKRLPFSDNLLRPCPLIDVPEALREIVGESAKRRTGAAAILEGEHARTMDRCRQLEEGPTDLGSRYCQEPVSSGIIKTFCFSEYTHAPAGGPSAKKPLSLVTETGTTVNECE